MHRSRLCAILLDCNAPTMAAGVRFWQHALGVTARDADASASPYVTLAGGAGGLERKCALLTCEGVPLLTRPAGILVNRERMYVGWRTERAYCKTTLSEPRASSPRRHAPHVVAGHHGPA